MSDEVLEDFGEAMEVQAEELREALAEDLDGEPGDYRPGAERVADGGGD